MKRLTKIRLLLFCLITLLMLSGHSSTLFAQTYSISSLEQQIKEQENRLGSLEKRKSDLQSEKNKLEREGHTYEERNSLTGDNVLENIDREISVLKEDIDECKSRIEYLKRQINNSRETERKLKEAAAAVQRKAKEAAAAKQKQSQAEEEAMEAQRQAEEAAAVREKQKQAEEEALKVQRQAEEAAAEARRAEEALRLAQETFERIKMEVAANNAYTRNIGPRNGWDDSKTGTTIIRETNRETDLLQTTNSPHKPKYYMFAEKLPDTNRSKNVIKGDNKEDNEEAIRAELLKQIKELDQEYEQLLKQNTPPKTIK